MTDPRTLERAVQRLDVWRAPVTTPVTPQGTYKEWMHFCIRLPEFAHGHLIVNLSFMERVLPAGTVRVPRVTVLAHTDRWRGRIESIEAKAVHAEPGSCDIRLGTVELRFREGHFLLTVRSPELDADLRLIPAVLPTVRSTVVLGPGSAMHWVAVSYLKTSGAVRMHGRRIEVADAPTYHDHNWGHFRWGSDLAWEWGFAHAGGSPADYTVVFIRVSDGSRHRTLSQGALLWQRGEHRRTFHDREIRVASSGTFCCERPLTVPGPMGLLAPGAASGVPAKFSMAAADGVDQLEIEFEPTAIARIAMPSEVDDSRVVLLNEAAGRALVRGRLGGENFQFDSSSVVEFVRG